MVTKRYAHILDENRRMLASEMEQQFYRQGGTAIQPAAAEKAPAMDANALAALLISNPELPTKVLQSVRTANNGWCCQQPRREVKNACSQKASQNRLFGSGNPASINLPAPIQAMRSLLAAANSQSFISRFY